MLRKGQTLYSCTLLGECGQNRVKELDQKIFLKYNLLYAKNFGFPKPGLTGLKKFILMQKIMKIFSVIDL
jgi:hypothetical protein